MNSMELDHNQGRSSATVDQVSARTSLDHIVIYGTHNLVAHENSDRTIGLSRPDLTANSSQQPLQMPMMNTVGANQEAVVVDPIDGNSVVAAIASKLLQQMVLFFLAPSLCMDGSPCYPPHLD